MHVLIGAITAIASLIWALVALQRSGFNLDSLNPFLMIRRAHWRKKYGLKPLHNLDDPMDVAAVLILATAKCEGEVTSEQRAQIMRIFTNVFKLNPKDASALMVSTSFLLREEMYIVNDLENILDKSKSKFTDAQADSVLSLMQQVASLAGSPNSEQNELIAATRNCLLTDKKQPGQWI